MPDPISIDPSQLNLNAPDTNVAAPPSAPGVEKFSLGEFENYTPTGQKPVLDEKGTKLAKEQPALVKKTPPTTETAKDTNQNVKKETTEKLETEVEDTGETTDIEEGKEGELDEDGGNKTAEQDQGEADKESETEGDEKIHGNSKRDYTGFSQNEIKVLKKLDNARFAAVTSMVKPYKEAAGKAIELARELESSKKLLKEGGVPDNWHEHPEAYQLSREFQELNTQYTYQEQADNHYQQQLLNIKQGKPWTPLQWNKVTNQMEYGQPQEPTDQAEMFVQRQLIAATNAKQNLDNRAAQIKQNHASSYERAAASIRSEVDDVVSKMHPDVKPKEEDVKLIQKVLPAQYSNHPLAYGYAQLGAIILAQGRKLQGLMKDQEQVTRLNQDIRKNGAAKPPGLKRPSSPAKGEGERLSMKMFGES
jgi:hypothetical protein